jgi:orotate phosphoribosyltransferase
MEKQIAKALLKIKAVTLSPTNPYTWASGIKSPIYCDNRLIIANPVERDLVVDSFVELILNEYSNLDLIAGVATSGIPWGALVADRLKLPMVYVRASAKEHGKQNAIEGNIPELKGKKVVIVEDLISTGGSVLAAVKELQTAEFQVLGVAAIFTYEMKKGYDAFETVGTVYKTLSNYSALIEEAEVNDYITADQLELLKNWHQQFE